MNKISAKKIVSFGFGNMAKAILQGKKDFSAIVTGKKQSAEINYLSINDELFLQKLPSKIEFLLLAIKPYQLQDAAQNLQKLNLAKNAIIVSILAGVSLEILEKYLPNSNIIRAMPNTPISCGCGITGIYLPQKLINFKEILEEIFVSKKSKIIYLKKEDDLNKITAISGSGSAYFFALIEAVSKGSNFSQDKVCRVIIANCSHRANNSNLMQYQGNLSNIVKNHCQTADGLQHLINSFIYLIFQNARDFGFSSVDAKILSSDLAFGCASYVLSELKNGKDAAQLKREVTSKNGTTAKALEVLESGKSSNLVSIVNLTIQAAYLRALEIENSFNN
jgi:pyrroline-5-carboxylate reductase